MQRAINEKWIAQSLSEFAIQSRVLKIGNQRMRGYEFSFFADAFTKFLTSSGQAMEPSAEVSSK